ncbi:hypothetical protein FB451DRAFT_1058907 [Mycena latifolia]|nr:hypothetical protein FB451DRAFT_1058907 [Mycena latifolia]
MCRRSLLEGVLNDNSQRSGPAPIAKLATVLQPKDPFRWKAPIDLLNGVEVADILARGTELTLTEYNSLLKYLCHTGEEWLSAYKNLPYVTGALIMPRHALEPSKFMLDGQTYSCFRSHRGGSTIQFKIPNKDTQATGFIKKIWQMPLKGCLKTFMLMEAHRPVRNKTSYDSLPLGAIIVEAGPSMNFIVIEPEHILTHLTAWSRPMGTYGIMRDILVVCWGLNRGRRK